MTSERSKGLAYVREVGRILSEKGYVVEGPGYGIAFYGGRMQPVHRDFFGVYDLLAVRHGIMTGHQVSTLTNKAVKVKAMQAAGLHGYVWCRCLNGRRVGWRVWQVRDEAVEIGMESL